MSDDTFSYAENQAADAIVGTLAANSDVATYEFATGGQTSADGFYAINNAGVITITTVGVAAGVNDFETGTNTGNYDVIVKDTAGNPTIITVTLNETNINDNAPIAVDDSVNATEDTPFTSIIDLDTNDTDVDGDSLSVTAGTFTTAQGGTIVIAVDGSYTYTPATNFNGIDTVDYTVSDGFFTDIGTLTIDVAPVNDTPTIQNDTVTVNVSEEGLTNGLVDATGTSDTTDATIITGSMVFNDVDGDTLTVALSNPIQPMTSGGDTITWSGTDTDTLTGSANGSDVITINITNTGDYTVTLLGPVDHPVNSVEDVLDFDINVAVSDGTAPAVNANLNITIEDDKAVSGDIVQDIEIPEQNTNLMFIVDTSGSMGWDADTGSSTITTVERMELLLTSMRDVINSYDDMGNVKIQIVTFDSGTDSTHQAQWFTVAEALAFIGDGTSGSRDATLEPDGGTDYDQAVLEAKDAYIEDGKIEATADTEVANITYFFSDGQPQTAGGTESSDGITGVEVTEWTDFLVANDISTYAVGFGSGLDANDQALLDPLAYDGLNDVERDGVIVTDSTTLAETLLGTIQPPLVGSVLGQLGTDGFGADGGYFYDLTIDGTTYTYNVTTDSISNSANAIVIVGSQLELDTLANGHISLDFATGEYVYEPDAGLAQGETAQEMFTFTAVDNDGDTSTGTATLNVSRESKVNSNENEVSESAMPGGTDSGSTAEIATGNILSDDDIISSDSLTDISITGGTTDNSVSGQITVTTAEGNILVVNTDSSSADFGDYIYTLVNAVSHYEMTETGNTITLDTDTFNNRREDGWTLSNTNYNGDNDNVLRIDGAGDTASKTFDFGVDYAGRVVTISFELETIGGWDSTTNDVFRFSANGTNIDDGYNYDTSSPVSYSIPVTLDSNGSVSIVMEADNTYNGEDLLIDNFEITGPELASTVVDSLVDSFVYTVTDTDGFENSANLDITIHDESVGNDNTLLFNDSVSIDGGIGFDTIKIADTDGDINFDTATIANIQNIEAIDLEDGTHNITISLDDVLDMTETGSNTLDITSLINDGDSVSISDNSGTWSNAVEIDNNDGTHSFEYTNSNSGDSITLTVDDQIDTTGM